MNAAWALVMGERVLLATAVSWETLSQTYETGPHPDTSPTPPHPFFSLASSLLVDRTLPKFSKFQITDQ